MTDLDLVNNIKHHILVDDSLAKLCVFHGALINKISSKYTKQLLDSGSGIEEIFKEREYIIYKAAMAFNPERKNKFSSYLGSCVRWYCLNKINKSDDWKFISETPLEECAEKPAEYKEDNFEYTNFLLNKIKNKNIKKVFELRYFYENEGLTWAKIGSMLNITGQTANNWHKKGLKILSSFVKSETATK